MFLQDGYAQGVHPEQYISSRRMAMRVCIVLIIVFILLSVIVGLAMAGIYAIYSAGKYMKSYIGW